MTDRLDVLHTEPLMDEKEFSRISAIPLPTLRTWRCRRKGPPFRKLPGSSMVRYGPEAVAWLNGEAMAAA